jgi:hypothetical protein
MIIMNEIYRILAFKRNNENLILCRTVKEFYNPEICYF